MPIPQWLQNGKDKYRGLTHKQIDCSHLLHRVLKDSGCTVKYLTTGALNDDKNDVRNKYYEKVDSSKMKPGDIILFDGHVGVVESYNPKTGTGKFFGSQTSTGPASTGFGPGTIKGWNKPFTILRPKPQYCPKTSSLRNDDAVPDKLSPDIPGSPFAQVNAATGLTSDDVHLTPAKADCGHPIPGSYDIRDKGTSEKIGSYAETPTGCEVTIGNDKVVADRISGSDVNLETYARNDEGDFELLGMSRIGENDGITVRRPFMGCRRVDERTFLDGMRKDDQESRLSS